jgi:uncharacterized protein YuzE
MAGLRVWYDQEGDFLEVTFEDVAATMEEVEEDVFERRAVDGRVVGFAVMNVSKHSLGKLTLPLEVKALPAA